jgi:hypothetical protein
MSNANEDDYPDGWDYYEDDHGGDCDCLDCENERAEQECGELPKDLGGGCSMSGSEYCDFECPFRNSVFGEDEEE